LVCDPWILGVLCSSLSEARRDAPRLRLYDLDDAEHHRSALSEVSKTVKVGTQTPCWRKWSRRIRLARQGNGGDLVRDYRPRAPGLQNRDDIAVRGTQRGAKKQARAKLAAETRHDKDRAETPANIES